jgi:hypothetical protein
MERVVNGPSSKGDLAAVGGRMVPWQEATT